jgi:hypothetical protein
MDHHEAERTQVADRYLLGELSAAEREQFEDHFFSCPVCAEEVRVGTLFRANVRAVFEEAPQTVVEVRKRNPTPAPSWLAWLTLRPAVATAWASACLLLGISGYQGLVMLPRLQSQLAVATAPQPYQSYVLHSLSRGDDHVLQVSRQKQSIGLRVNLVPPYEFRNYQGEILNEAGSSLLTVLSPAPQRRGDPLGFLIRTSSLPPGAYTMVVHGLDDSSPQGPGTTIETYRFIIEHK